MADEEMQVPCNLLFEHYPILMLYKSSLFIMQLLHLALLQMEGLNKIQPQIGFEPIKR